MTITTYQAYSMAEALAAVKRDLGKDAVILETRSFKRGGMMGVGAKTIVEVSAMKGDEVKTAAISSPRSRPQAAAARAYAAPKPAPMPETSAVDEQLLKLLESRRSGTSEADRTQRQEQASPPRPAAEPRNEPGTPRRFVLTPDAATASPAPVRTQTTRDMQNELAAIRDMVGQVLQKQNVQHGARNPDTPEELFDVYLTLIGQDVSEELADDIVDQVRAALPADQLTNTDAIRAETMRRIASLVPTADVCEPGPTSDGRPRTIALIGPTGVGKTTTLAKLAATFKLKHGKSVGLITADTYRIAAVDQLRTYAEIIGLPVEVVLTPEDMTRAVDQLCEQGVDVILIDTAGRGPNDTDRLAELRAFLRAAHPHETHLVLAGTASEKVLLREAEAFSPLGADHVVLTKLDEAVSFGMLVGVVRQVGKQLSFVTTGQEVPDHLEVGRPQRLAELVMGGDLRA